MLTTWVNTGNSELHKRPSLQRHLGDPRERLHFSDWLFRYGFPLPSKIHNCVPFSLRFSLELRWMYRPSIVLSSWNMPLGCKIPIIRFGEVLFVGERLKWTGRNEGHLWLPNIFFSQVAFATRVEFWASPWGLLPSNPTSYHQWPFLLTSVMGSVGPSPSPWNLQAWHLLQGQ